MEASKPRYVLDTSAILALREDEEGADKVESLLRQGESGNLEVYAPFMMYMEAYYRVWQIEGPSAARSVYGELRALPIQSVELSESLLLQAGGIKAQYRVSLGDAWILATAQMVGGILVHKDPDMEQAAERVQLKSLPYKQQAL